MTNHQSELGSYIRRKIIPEGVDVTAAARKLGVSRGALSNLLNGRATLSDQMAKKLSITFGADEADLLARRQAGRPVPTVDNATRSHQIPHEILRVRAANIERWACDELSARTRLPVLLRRLVHASDVPITLIDFPGNDEGERAGNDGKIVAREATAWVPRGTSYWEFGTTANVSKKAESDYAARLKMPEAERLDSTFVFVTPRRWQAKNKWIADKNAEGRWGSVRAYDSNDLEQWLETTLGPQVWLAEELGMPTFGLKSPQDVGRWWRDACDPPLSDALFDDAISTAATEAERFLSGPPTRPLIVRAESRDEAAGFTACLLAQNLPEQAARTVFAEDTDTVRRLIASDASLAIVAMTREVEQQLVAEHRRSHCILLRARGERDIDPDIVVEPLRVDAFRTALSKMGKSDGEIDNLIAETGRSPTVLRRRLSGALTPSWAEHADLARSVVPIALAGSWDKSSEGDKAALTQLYRSPGVDFEAIEEAVATLEATEDPPAWREGRVRGIVSKVDALFAVRGFIQDADLDAFFEVAERVLSEEDPRLELPEDERWLAGSRGISREHSGYLRRGLRDTLVVLAVHGDALMRPHSEVNLPRRAGDFVRKLLTPLSKTLPSQIDDLIDYAEAAPDTFLSILEDDLAADSSAAKALVGEHRTSALGFDSCSRASLLWALEGLAWADHFPRVSNILAALSDVTITDNVSNRPIESLSGFYRCWFPQTGATVELRKRCLELMLRRYPDAALKICFEQVESGRQMATHAHRPSYRPDASGFGGAVTYGEIHEVQTHALNLLLSYDRHDVSGLEKLLDLSADFDEASQLRVWDLVDCFAAERADEPQRAALRDGIRRSLLTIDEVSLQTQEAESSPATRRAVDAWNALASPDPVLAHAWLFRQAWIAESFRELRADEIDFRARDERIISERAAGILKIFESEGVNGVVRSAELSEAPGIVGQSLARCDADVNDVAFVEAALGTTQEDWRRNALVAGYLAALSDEARASIAHRVMTVLSSEKLTVFLTCLPFGAATWKLVEAADEDTQRGYWADIHVNWVRGDTDDVSLPIERLIAARRPWSAFFAVSHQLNDVPTELLVTLLIAMATTDGEGANLANRDYYIAEAFKTLDGRGIEDDRLVLLELMFLPLLARSKRGMPALDAKVADDPSLFMQLIGWGWKRKEAGEDPAQWFAAPFGDREVAASLSFEFFYHTKMVPGLSVEGHLDAKRLNDWVEAVRRAASENARMEIADIKIGSVLTNASEDATGQWPPRPVCDVLERYRSKEMGDGFYTAIMNARGVHWRGEGGGEERTLAEKYRMISKKIRIEYPFVGKVFDMVVSSYEQQAEYEDGEARLRKRLP
jgi:plasmid maintenance system antidote protein VapI